MDKQVDSIAKYYGVKNELLVSSENSVSFSSNPLQQYLHSSNELGDIYRIPKNVGFNIDYDLILKTFIGCEVIENSSYTQIVVIHQGALQKSKRNELV